VTQVTAPPGTDPAILAIRAIQDRIDITDVLYRYASTIDRFDTEGLRRTLADDLWARYGNAEPLVGGEAVANWIAQSIAPVIWQHHLLSVYHVDVDGDRARRLYEAALKIREDLAKISEANDRRQTELMLALAHAGRAIEPFRRGTER